MPPLPDSTRLQVRLTPRGGRDAIDGWLRGDDGAVVLKVRVSAPPLDGEANAALIRLIARGLKRPGGAVRIVSGAHGRLKLLELDGVTPADVALAFGAPPEPPDGGA